MTILFFVEKQNLYTNEKKRKEIEFMQKLTEMLSQY